MQLKERLDCFPEQKLIRIPENASVDKTWQKADLHLHALDTHDEDGITDYASRVNSFLGVAEQKGLQIVAFTEHDNNQNFDLVWRIGRESKIQVIAGAEITVRVSRFKLAHLLIYFPDRDCVPSQKVYDAYFARGKNAWRAIKGIHEMDGFCIVPHPMSPLTVSFGKNDLKSIQQRKTETLFIDGFEILNPTPAGLVARPRIITLFEQGNLGGAVGGSDGRLQEHTGFAYTRFNGETVKDFIHCLCTGQTVAEGGNAYSLAQNLNVGHQQAKRFFSLVKNNATNFFGKGV